MKTVLFRITSTHHSASVSVRLDPTFQAEDSVQRLIVEIPEKILQNIPADLESPGKRIDSRELGEGGSSSGVFTNFDDHARSLYDLIFPQPVIDQLKLLKAADAQIENCRLVLDELPPTLRNLRWEMMAAGPLRPALRPNCSVVRGPIDLADRCLTRDGPIKLLIVVGTKSNHEIGAQEEIDAIQKTFAGRESELIVRILDRAAIQLAIDRKDAANPREAVKLAYREFQPHILHFIGHGKLDDEGVPFLVLYDPDALDQVLRWTVNDVAIDFDKTPPAFFFLNACYSVNGVAHGQGWSMADIFLDQLKSRAVLGMHGAVLGQTAGKLAAALYNAFIAGDCLDLALSDARRSADVLKSSDARRAWDWALPFLRLRVLPEHVIPVRFIPEDWKGKIKDFYKFKTNKYFVNREATRTRFLNVLQTDAKRSSNVILVRGEQKSGKSSLLFVCLEAAGISGRLVKYVDLNGKNAVDGMGVLKKIREGNAGSLVNWPLPDALFAPISLEPLDANGPQDQQDKVFRSFMSALAQVPAQVREDRAVEAEKEGNPDEAEKIRKDTRPLILVLDQLTSPHSRGESNGAATLRDVFKDAVVEGLIKPIASRREKDILLVLAVRKDKDDDEEQALGLSELDPPPVTIDIDELPVEDFTPFATDFLRRRAGDADWKWTAELGPEDWTAQFNGRAKVLARKQKRWPIKKLFELFDEIKRAMQ